MTMQSDFEKVKGAASNKGKRYTRPVEKDIELLSSFPNYLSVPHPGRMREGMSFSSVMIRLLFLQPRKKTWSRVVRGFLPKGYRIQEDALEVLQADVEARGGRCLQAESALFFFPPLRRRWQWNSWAPSAVVSTQMARGCPERTRCAGPPCRRAQICCAACAANGWCRSSSAGIHPAATVGDDSNRVSVCLSGFWALGVQACPSADCSQRRGIVIVSRVWLPLSTKVGKLEHHAGVCDLFVSPN